MKNTFFCIDAHTCGNPVRVVAGGVPPLSGKSIVEKRLHFIREYDWIRKGLMFEPRGHDMMSGSIILPPSSPENDAAILFIETSGCLPMCGHGTIGTVTVAIAEGLIIPQEEHKLRLETPAGLVLVSYETEGGRVASVKLTNVPSFLYKENLTGHCDLGTLRVDVAYGGNFYAIVDPQENYEGLQKHTASQLIGFSLQLRKSLREGYEFTHPLDDQIKGLSHVLWTGKTLSEKSTARNAVFYGDKAIDRSPCGTGTSARMAQWHAKRKLNVGEAFVHESYIGSQFVGRIESQTTCGSFDAIIPSIEGWAKITGYNHIVIDRADDPYAHGFQVF